MMFGNRRAIPVAILGGLFLAATLLHGAAVAGDKYDAQNAKFRSLKQKTNSHIQSGRYKIGKARVGGANVNVMTKGRFDPTEGQAIKVWFEKVRPGENQGSGEYTNFLKSNWQPGERFYLWFETSSPITVSLWQTYPGTSKERRLVLPQDQFPKSSETIQPGQPRRFEVLMAMDNNNENETMEIEVKFSGEIDSDAMIGDAAVDESLIIDDSALLASNEGGIQGDGGSIRKKIVANHKAIAKAADRDPALRKKLRFADISANNDSDDPKTSTSPDEVAALAFTPNPVGIITIDLKKQSPAIFPDFIPAP